MFIIENKKLPELAPTIEQEIARDKTKDREWSPTVIGAIYVSYLGFANQTINNNDIYDAS